MKNEDYEKEFNKEEFTDTGTSENDDIKQKVKEYEEQAKKRKLVLPGEELGQGIAGSGAYLDQGKVVSKVLGLAERKDNIHFVIPLNGPYIPKKGDGVIGIIAEVPQSKWIVDINSPYTAVMLLSEAVEEYVDLTKTDLTKYYNYGDIIFAKITSVTKAKQVALSMRDRRCRKLYEGRIVKITPTKVPRIIGKEGSMVELIKKKTGCQIVVGQNGLIWVKGGKKHLAVEAIMKIEQYAHTVGLTDKIEEFLNSKVDLNENKSGEPETGAETNYGEENEQ